MRTTNSYTFWDPYFKYRLLKWAQKFDKHCFLNSNDPVYSQTFEASFDCLAGIDTISEIEDLNDSFGSLKSFYETKKDWLFGYLSYDLKNETENLYSRNSDNLQFPIIHFFQPRFVFELKSDEIKVHHFERKEFIDDLVLEIKNVPIEEAKPSPDKIDIKNRVNKEDYLSVINTLKKHIVKGDIYEINYCQEFYAEGQTINPLNTYLDLNKISPTPFSCFYKLNDKFLMSASPERFIKKAGQKIISQPIKGTIRRGKTPEEDCKLKQDLRNNPKEQAENIMIVDLVRNDLARTANPGTVKVDELFGIYTFSQVHQMISTISSELNPSIHFVDAIKDTFPMGSMTGAPKISAMELIEKYEKTKRGLYSGAVGYITPHGDFDFNVVIRSLIYNSSMNYLSFMVGSAITGNSIPVEEYEECLVKAEAIMKVLKMVNR